MVYIIYMTNDDRFNHIERYGFGSYDKEYWGGLNLSKYKIARIIAEYRGLYKAIANDGEYLARITGRHIFDSTDRECFPAVGDWVGLTDCCGGKAIISMILPRNTILKKKNASMRERYGGRKEAQVIATNIDTAFIIESTDRDFNLNRLDRYLVQISDGGIKPAIIINKIDLISETELKNKIEQINMRFKDVDVIPTSVLTEMGLAALNNYIKDGKTYCFVGSSGVGKSSLINKLLQDDRIRINEVGKNTGRGKHTTTNREMYRLSNGGLIIDNPGSREVGLTDSTSGIEDVFREIADLSRGCRYNNCTHIHEPGCAVLAAIKEKTLDQEKYESFKKLKRETEYYEMSELEKREKDRKFGRFIKKANDQMKKTK